MYLDIEDFINYNRTHKKGTKMSLEITEIKIRPIKSKTKICAFAKVTFNNAFCVNSIKIIDGKNGLFIGMPSEKDKEGNFRDIAFPINSETRKYMTDAILEEYEKEASADPF